MFEDSRLHQAENLAWCVEVCIKDRWYRYLYTFQYRHQAGSYRSRLEIGAADFEPANWKLLN